MTETSTTPGSRPQSGGASIVYLICGHKLPQQIIRLVERLRTGNASFLIHIDRRSDEHVHATVKDALSAYDRVHFLKRRSTGWGGFGLVQAELSAIDFALKHIQHFEYLVFLSGQDYPLQSAEAIEAFFSSAENPSGFVQSTKLPNPRWAKDGGLDRVRFHHVRLRSRYVACFKHDEINHRLIRPVWNTLARSNRFGTRTPPLYEDYYGGAALMTLSRDATRYIHDFRRRHRRFMLAFRTIKNSDEVFFQTVLGNSPLNSAMRNELLHYVDWSGGGTHPKTLTIKDLASLRRSTQLFARKFDVTLDPDVLDAIDHDIDTRA